MYDSNSTLDGFLAATAGRQATPGGGSVSALVGALAAASGEMVLNYSLGKKSLGAYEGEMKPALTELMRARQVLLQLMVEDQAAYEALGAMRKLGAEQRKDGMPAALLVSIRVPQAIGASALAILQICDRIINFVDFGLLAELAVCADLAMATVRCSIYCVRVNVRDLSDEADRRSIEGTASQLLSHGAELIQRVSPRIWARDSQGV